MAAATVKLPQFYWPPPNPPGRKLSYQHFGNASADSNIGEDGDLIKCVKMFKGRLPVDFEFWTQNLDSNAAPTQAIAVYFTDGTTTKYIVGSSTEGSLVTCNANGGIIKGDPENLTNWQWKDNFDSMKWELRIEVITSAATEATGLYGGYVATIGPS